jgi:hypothetical protein
VVLRDRMIRTRNSSWLYSHAEETAASLALAGTCRVVSDTSCTAKPDATNVAGLRTWNSLGRFVKRGEKGIFIQSGSLRSEHGALKSSLVQEGSKRAKGLKPNAGFDPGF